MRLVLCYVDHKWVVLDSWSVQFPVGWLAAQRVRQGMGGWEGRAG